MEEIERRAEAVLGGIADHVWGGEKPPIPIEEIAASHFCLRVVDADPERMAAAPGCPPLAEGDTLSGLLLPSLGEIWVNAEEAEEWPARRRFTIGHELGHWVLHRSGQQTLFCRSKTVQPEEADDNAPDIEEEASVFAAAMLMPAELVRHYWGRTGDHGVMCKIFNCSGAAMGRRLHAVV